MSCHLSPLNNNSKKSYFTVHLIHPTIHPTRSNWAISHLSTRRHLLMIEARHRVTNSPSLHWVMPSPLVFWNASPVTTPPIHHFSPRFPFNSKVDALKIYHHHRAHPVPTHFLPTLRPIKGTKRAVVPPPHSFPHVLPTKIVAHHHSSLPPSRFRYPAATCRQRWSSHRLPPSHRSVVASYHVPQWPRIELQRATPSSMDDWSTLDRWTSKPPGSTKSMSPVCNISHWKIDLKTPRKEVYNGYATSGEWD
jgi:hypothetical protein